MVDLVSKAAVLITPPLGKVTHSQLKAGTIRQQLNTSEKLATAVELWSQLLYS